MGKNCGSGVLMVGKNCGSGVCIIGKVLWKRREHYDPHVLPVNLGWAVFYDVLT